MHGIGQHRRESFARYYLRQVAVGEGCNCAEQVLGSRPSPARPAGDVPSARKGRGWLRRLFSWNKSRE